MKQQVLIVEDEFIVANHIRTLLIKADYEVCGIAASVSEAKELIDKKKPAWVLLDIFLQDGSIGTDLGVFLNDKGIAFIYISANTNFEILEKAKATHPYGFLVKPFQERDLLTMMEIAREKHLNQIQFNQQLQLVLQNQLELIANSFLTTDEKLAKIPGLYQPLIPFDLLTLSISKSQLIIEDIAFVRSGFNEYQILNNKDYKDRLGLTAKDIGKYRETDYLNIEKKIYSSAEYNTLKSKEPLEKSVSENFQVESKLYYPIEMKNGTYSSISFYSRKCDFYKIVHLSFLTKALKQLSYFIDTLNQGNKDAINDAAYETEKKTGAATTKPAYPEIAGIIGKSLCLLNVLDNVSMVAPSQTSVLILGESGTGKERIAQCIHQLSPRKSKPIITVNCGALQKDLIESELFGHVKGAFTGALENRIGKFELANGGSIFLDEVGELTLDAQVKLLRVLQEREIEHVGGSQSIKVNVRVIAATNRNLEKEVAAGRFRLDLYYRLNVFPIDLPALRERKDDIPILAEHFLQKFSTLMGKEKPALSRNVLKQMNSYHWPGNIRELEHLMERSLLLCKGPELSEIHFPVNAKEIYNNSIDDSSLKTLEQMEADYILSVLRKVKGKIGGAGGAAEILGLPSSTLNSRIKKLGIHKESNFNQ